MEYNDEQILNIKDYEIMAKAYASEFKKRGFMVVQVDEEENNELIEKIFEKLVKIKSHLLMLFVTNLKYMCYNKVRGENYVGNAIR